MISFERAPVADKQFISMLLYVILKNYGLHTHYRIEKNGDPQSLYIRESTLNRPSSEMKALFAERIVGKLKGIINFQSSFFLLGGRVSVPAIKLKQYDENFIRGLLNSNNQEAPTHIDTRIWAMIPARVKQKWSAFTRDLQDFIVECMSLNLEEKYNKFVTFSFLSDSLQSPISLEPPVIPVRLPNSHLPSHMTNEVFDLVEVLDIRQRDPTNINHRRNPITRDYFGLAEIIPDRNSLKKINDGINLKLSTLYVEPGSDEIKLEEKDYSGFSHPPFEERASTPPLPRLPNPSTQHQPPVALRQVERQERRADVPLQAEGHGDHRSNSSIPAPVVPVVGLTEQQVVVQFYKAHNALLDKRRFCGIGFFRTGIINWPYMSLEEIVKHALEKNNRTRQIMIDKKWLDGENPHADAPECIKEMVNSINRARSSNRRS